MPRRELIAMRMRSRELIAGPHRGKPRYSRVGKRVWLEEWIDGRDGRLYHSTIVNEDEVPEAARLAERLESAG